MFMQILIDIMHYLDHIVNLDFDKFILDGFIHDKNFEDACFFILRFAFAAIWA